jgi:sec-independent protein translocase protein TatB
MFDISWGKLVIIGVVALLVIGPKELPAVLRTLGQYMAKIRRMAAEFQGQFQEAMREAEMADLKKQFDETASAFTSAIDPSGIKSDIEKMIENPLGETPKAAESTPEPAAATDPAALGTAPVAAPPDPAAPEPAAPAPVADVSVPMPELPPPVSEADFAPPQPAAPDPSAPKPAAEGGKAA